MPTLDAAPLEPIEARLQELEQETDYEFVVELIDLYLEEAPKQLQAIETAIKAQSLPSLMITAHTLKGSSLNLGAKQFGELCLKLEEIGRAGISIPDGTNISALEREYENVKATLVAFKNSKP
jgi:HPt (histidine-containing phosphotransfer) domain-containing protein